MKRRQLIYAAGAVTAAGVATLGSGAFTVVEADRSIAADVVGDAEAFLAFDPVDEDIATKEGGQLKLTIDDTLGTTDGEGVPKRAKTSFTDVFDVTNQGTQSVSVYGKAEEKPAVRLLNNGSVLNSDDPVTVEPGNSKTLSIKIDTGDVEGIGTKEPTFTIVATSEE